jgi:dienelactone hydrolase
VHQVYTGAEGCILLVLGAGANVTIERERWPTEETQPPFLPVTVAGTAGWQGQTGGQLAPRTIDTQPPEILIAATGAEAAAESDDAQTSAMVPLRSAHADREQVLRACQEVMGPLRQRTAETMVSLDVQFEDDEAAQAARDSDDARLAASGVSRKKISYLSEEGDRISAYLCLPPSPPKGAQAVGPAPAMVCLHGTSGGDGGIVGVKGDYGSYGDSYGAHGDDPGMHYGLELAERGFVTISPDYIFLASRRSDDEPARLQELGWGGGTIKGVWDHMRAIDVLVELSSVADSDATTVAVPTVDPNRIGAIGCSLGGHNALFLAAFDPRCSLAVTSCGFDSFLHYAAAGAVPAKAIHPWAQHKYMPRVASEYDNDPTRLPWDYPDLLAIIAPTAPVYIHAAVSDSNFRVDSVRQCVDVARAAIASSGSGDPMQRIVASYPPGGHGFPLDAREEAYAFVEQHLVHGVGGSKM